MSPPLRKPYWFTFVLLSLTSIIFTAAVWSAGSPQYGAISEVWKTISVPALLLMDFSLLVVCALGLFLSVKSYGVKSYLAPVILLGVAAVPFVLVLFLVAIHGVIGD